jgi:hypothetical protein
VTPGTADAVAAHLRAVVELDDPAGARGVIHGKLRVHARTTVLQRLGGREGRGYATRRLAPLEGGCASLLERQSSSRQQVVEWRANRQIAWAKCTCPSRVPRS